ncbi:isoprenoid synthase domain-containing protein [Lanmaoa asiatica]|nr:isoprenoid synthase domain-containing protein [Lanmaoa asiatica]
MPTEAYRFPDLLALFPEKPGGEINPHFKELEVGFNAWVEKHFGGPRAVEVSRCENPLLIAATFPLASRDQLRAIVGCFAVSFLLDDLFDRSSIENVTALSQLWTKALLDGNEGKGVQHPLIEIVRRLVYPFIRPVMGSFHWQQFLAEYEISINNMVQETHDRAAYQNKNANLDIQSYMIKRRLFCGARVCFPIVRATRCLYISDDVLASTVVQEMEEATADMVFIVNDIHSFKKEYDADGAFSNLLTVIQKDPETAHLDFQGRLDYAEKLLKAALDRFQACRRDLPSFGPEMDQYLAVYADGLLDWAIGNLQWSRVTSRYNRFTNDEDRRNNIVRLALDGSPEDEKDVPIL